MSSTYFRIVKDFKGDETVFFPEYAHEQIQLCDGVYVETNSGEKIKEVCFSKTIEGCLFAINMFLKEGDYHIYKSNKNPYLDLSNSGLGDFPAIQEVRYKTPVLASYVGKLNVTSYLIHCLTGLYEECNKRRVFNLFDYKLASSELERFKSVNDEIIHSKEVS